jgi:hypothetical protein
MASLESLVAQNAALAQDLASAVSLASSLREECDQHHENFESLKASHLLLSHSHDQLRLRAESAEKSLEAQAAAHDHEIKRWRRVIQDKVDELETLHGALNAPQAQELIRLR